MDITEKDMSELIKRVYDSAFLDGFYERSATKSGSATESMQKCWGESMWKERSKLQKEENK